MIVPTPTAPTRPRSPSGDIPEIETWAEAFLRALGATLEIDNWIRG